MNTEKARGWRDFFHNMGVLETIFLVAMTLVFAWIILGNCISVMALLLWVAVAWTCFGRVLSGGLHRLSRGRELPVGALIFFFSLFLRVLVLLVLHPPIASDFANIYNASRLFLVGDYSFQDDIYFQRWAGQTGQVVLQGVLLRVWDSVFFLQLVHSLCAAGTDALIYLCGRVLFTRRAACMTAILHTVAIFPLTLSAVLTNQHMGTFFTYLALYLLIAPVPENCGKPRVWLGRSPVRFSLAGVLVALANVIRPDALITLVAVGAYCVFGIVRFWGREGLRRFGVGLVLFVGMYAAVFEGISFGVCASGINAKGLHTAASTLKLVYGFNRESKGQFTMKANEAINAYVAEGMDREEAMRTVLAEELQMGVGELVRHLENKQAVLWKGNGLEPALHHVFEWSPYLRYCAVNYDSFCAWGSLLLAAPGFFTIWKRKPVRLESLLPPFLLFSAYCAYLLIEVQPRYMYGLQPALYILAAGGLEALWRLWTGLRARKEQSA